MQLIDLMSRDVEVIRPDATLIEAARKMRQRDVGSLPVCDGRRLLGMITDRDIVVRALAQGRDPSRTRVHDVCTERVLYAREDDDVRDVARVMESEQIRRMPVVDRNKRLVGIVALGDLAVEDEDLSGEVLEGVSQPRHWSRLSQTGGGRAMHVSEITRGGREQRARGSDGHGWRGERVGRGSDAVNRGMGYGDGGPSPDRGGHDPSWRDTSGRESRERRGVAEKQIWDHDDALDRTYR